MRAERLAHLAAQRDLLDVMVAHQYTPYADPGWRTGLDPALLLQMYVLDPDPVQHTAKFLKLWRPPYGAHVLDCGCGTGSFAALVQAQRPDLHWTLMGHNWDQLTHAQRVAPCCQGDIHALPFAPGTFDAVILSYVLGYGFAPTVFGEVAQALKPGGMCVLYDMLGYPDAADDVLVQLGYKCYGAQIKAYAAAQGWQMRYGQTVNALLHPEVDNADTQDLRWLEDATVPVFYLWENVGTTKDTLCPPC
jgi:ubiquinone/menaquinone biosynthesis C-methylase UbiE